MRHASSKAHLLTTAFHSNLAPDSPLPGGLSRGHILRDSLTCTTHLCTLVAQLPLACTSLIRLLSSQATPYTPLDIRPRTA